MDISVVIEYILSMKWLWLVIIIMLYDLAKKIINTYARNIALKSDVIIRDTQYKEEDIIKHLDYIIKETLDEYILLQIRPKQIFYINNKIETEIINYLLEENNDHKGVFFSNLNYQVWNRCLNYNPKTEKRRHTMQFKWSSMVNDVKDIISRRNGNAN